jgi:hypothetical protein
MRSIVKNSLGVCRVTDLKKRMKALQFIAANRARSVSETFSFVESVRGNPATDTFDFPGCMNSYILEEKISPRRGLWGQAPPKEKRVFIQRIPGDGSGSALTLILRNLNIHIR